MLQHHKSSYPHSIVLSDIKQFVLIGQRGFKDQSPLRLIPQQVPRSLGDLPIHLQSFTGFSTEVPTLQRASVGPCRE